MKLGTFGSVVFAAMITTSSLAGAQTVGFGTGPQGTMTNAAGAAIAKIANEAAGLQTRAMPHTSNDLHMPLVNRAAIQFGMSNIQSAHAAINGTEQYKGRQQGKIRIVGRLFPLPVGVLARKDSDIKSLTDLKGKRFPVGYTAQPTVIGVVNAILANAGLSTKDVEGVQVPNTTRGNEDFMQGRVDAVFGSLGGARLRQVDARVGGIRVLPFDSSPDAVKRMKDAFPHAYLIELKPDRGSVGVEKPIQTMAYDFLIVSSTEVPDDIVYEVTKAIHNKRDGLISVSRAFERFDPKKMATQYEGTEHHPGAIRYYKEAGLWPKG